MPELPEVETTRRALEPYLLNQRIAKVEVRRRDLRQPITENLEDIIADQHIAALRRIGKYILIDTDKGETLLVHLGMSGSFRISPELPTELKKHDHFLLHMQGGVTAIFHDPRRFGVILLGRTKEMPNHPLLASMGIDPLDKAFTPAYLLNGLQRYKSAIKIAILDQHLIPGMGNIYASESLFLAGIHPDRPANQLTKEEATTLTKAIKKVLNDALKSGGSTLKDYMSGESVSGYFQHRFAVYDKEEESCTRPRCHGYIRRKVMGGRATYFCTECQS